MTQSMASLIPDDQEKSREPLSQRLADGAMVATDRRWAIGIAAVSFLLGLAFLFIVRPGIPYDEPSHFNVIQNYAQLNGLPIVGNPGVSYEAYHAPLYYALMGLIYRSAVGHLTLTHTFYLLRLITLCLFPLLVYLVYLAAIVFTKNTNIAIGAAIFIGLNPSLLAIASSIQNDSLVFFLCTVGAYACLRWSQSRTPSIGQALLLGLIVGLAVLTKTSALPLVAFVPGVLLFRWGRRGMIGAGIVLAIAALLTGWWFARNIRLYGDWTGGNAIEWLIAGRSTYRLTSLHDWLHAAQSVVTYCSLPVEYWRNQIKAGMLGRLIVAGSALILGTGAIASLISNRAPRIVWKGRLYGSTALLLAFSVACLVFWLAACVKRLVLPARVAMPGLAGIALAIGIAGNQLALRINGRRRQTIAIAAAFTMVLICLNLLMLFDVWRAPHGPYEIQLGLQLTTLTPVGG